MIQKYFRYELTINPNNSKNMNIYIYSNSLAIIVFKKKINNIAITLLIKFHNIIEYMLYLMLYLLYKFLIYNVNVLLFQIINYERPSNYVKLTFCIPKLKNIEKLYSIN